MALFGIGKQKTPAKTPAKGKDALREIVEAAAPTKTKERKVKPTLTPGAKDVIVRPRVTEKAANLTSNNVYTFDVRVSATKQDVMNSVKALYKVSPIKVRVVNTPAKRVRLRRKRGFGTKAATRKAYVYLKKGDSITLA
jgi:large subunit ribosomal protein L23